MTSGHHRPQTPINGVSEKIAPNKDGSGRGRGRGSSCGDGRGTTGAGVGFKKNQSFWSLLTFDNNLHNFGHFGALPSQAGPQNLQKPLKSNKICEKSRKNKSGRPYNDAEHDSAIFYDDLRELKVEVVS